MARIIPRIPCQPILALKAKKLTGNRITGVCAMSVLAPPNRTLRLVQPSIQSDYSIKTKFLGEISIDNVWLFVHNMLIMWKKKDPLVILLQPLEQL
jgi:hypothetical protein